MKMDYDFHRRGATLVSNEMIIKHGNVNFLREVFARAIYMDHEKFMIVWV